MSQYGDFSKLLIPGGLPAIPTTFRTTSGDAIPALNVLTLTNGANITFSGAGSAITAALSGTTNHAIQVGNVGGSLTSLAVGATGTVLCGVTGADPAFSATPTVTTLYAGTFDTNVAAAGLTLSGTTLSADGTDVDININITAKGAGKVIIDDLQLGTPLTVPYGGIGTNTLTDHGVVVGRGVGALEATANGATGTILQGVTGANPTFSTATYPSTVTKGDVLVASANNVVGVVNDVVNAGYVLTANAAAAPTFQAVPTYTLPATVPQSFPTDAGTATPALNALTVTGGTNINSSGAGATVTVNLDDTITLSTVNATTFDTNVLAAGTTLSGTTWAADGTDANIGMTITPKGTGALTLTTGDVTISSGNINLPNSTASIGIIKWNGNSYIHNSGQYSSFFAGYEAGRPSGSQGCVGVGYRALKNVDAGGTYNNAFGANSLAACTTGYYNTGFGQATLFGLTSGYSCIGIGHQALYNTGTGYYMIGIGEQAGYSAGAANHSDIYIGNLGASENNTIRIGTYGTGTGQQNVAYIAGVVHGTNGLTADAGNISATAGSVSASTTVTAGTDLASTAGNLKLPTSTSTVGQIRINNVRVFHTYAASGANTFVGQESGNFTTTAGANTGLGTYTLQSLTSGSGGNSAFGYGSLQACTSGYNNVAFGNSCLYNLTQGHHNTSVGPYPTASNLTTGSFNVTIGTTGLQNGTSGSYWGAGKNLTSNETSNFLIAALGVTGESNRLEIGYGSGTGSAQINKAFIHGIYGRTPVGTLNVALIDSNGQLGSTATLPPSLGGAMTWTEVTGTSQAAAVNNGYITNNVALVTVTLPSTAAVGERVAITGKGAGLWTLAQNAGQTVHFGSFDTTTGAGGSITASVRYDCIEVQCITANTDWVVIRSVGALVIV